MGNEGTGNMAFQKLPGNRGLVYVPERGKCAGKHPCRDCFSCQWCGDERCRVCRPLAAGTFRRKKPGSDPG